MQLFVVNWMIGERSGIGRLLRKRESSFFGPFDDAHKGAHWARTHILPETHTSWKVEDYSNQRLNEARTDIWFSNLGRGYPHGSRLHPHATPDEAAREYAAVAFGDRWLAAGRPSFEAAHNASKEPAEEFLLAMRAAYAKWDAAGRAGLPPGYPASPFWPTAQDVAAQVGVPKEKPDAS